MSDLISRQAAIAEFSCCELTPDGGIDANYAIDFLEQLPSVQEQRWIPVTERLPDKKGHYLATNLGRVYITGFNGEAFGLRHVTAWMSLPEPYKEGE